MGPARTQGLNPSSTRHLKILKIKSWADGAAYERERAASFRRRCKPGSGWNNSLKLLACRKVTTQLNHGMATTIKKMNLKGIAGVEVPHFVGFDAMERGIVTSFK